MNKQRRKQLEKALKLLHEANEIIESIRDEEQASFDNMPESLQSGERGQAMEEHIQNMDDAMDSVNSSIQSLETVLES